MAFHRIETRAETPKEIIPCSEIGIEKQFTRSRTCDLGENLRILSGDGGGGQEAGDIQMGWHQVEWLKRSNRQETRIQCNATLRSGKLIRPYRVTQECRDSRASGVDGVQNNIIITCPVCVAEHVPSFYASCKYACSSFSSSSA